MRHRLAVVAAAALLAGLGLSPAVYAQNAQISGTVRDSSGGVVPGALPCPGFANLDLRLSKSLRFQKHRFELIGQLFNVTNRANFNVPISNPTAVAFGTVNQLLPNINAPSRQVEIAVRYQF